MIDINKPIPDDIREQLIPSWFEPELFPAPDNKLNISDSEWHDRLSEKEYRTLRSEETEMPHVNEYHETDIEGVYICRACSNPLFPSSTKFNSGSGWPSFFAPISIDRIGIKSDTSLLTERTEVHCARCNGHLGHVFNDGPEPTGLRYCLNSPALRLIDQPSHQLIAEGREDELNFTLHR